VRLNFDSGNSMVIKMDTRKLSRALKRAQEALRRFETP
jgi:hypothetical protein